MVINLCRNSEAINTIVKKSYAKEKILDITGVINEFSTNQLRLSSIDKDGKLEVLAVKNYVSFIGNLSRASVDHVPLRDFRILGEPLFWFTPIAEKHDSFHWGKDVWLLYTLLIEKVELFPLQSVILLPAAYRHITPLLNEFFRIACLERPKIVYVGRSSVTISKTENLFRVSKQLVKALRLRRQIRAKLTERLFQEKTNVFIYSVSGNSENKIENNGDLGAVYQLSANISNSIGIPFISSLDYNWKETDSQFVSAYPSLFELWRMFREQIRMFNHLTSFRNKTCLVGEIEIPFELVSQEMLLGLRYSHMVNLAWFSNYFERLDAGVKVFFSDEFYTTGRILSAAARKCNRKNITTYGVQHGLLLENHTVYRISDLEFEDFIRRNDGLPKPDFFVTWGSYFSNLFLQINSLPEEYVIAAGNLKYCTLSQKEFKRRSNTSKLQLLWCTTLPAFFRAEYSIVEEVLKEMDNYELCFRLHPGGHLKKEQISDWISPDVLSRSSFSTEPDIFQDIANHDVVLSTVFSTTFFDGLIMGKKTCRIFTGISKADFSSLPIENLYDVNTTEDFRRLFSDFHEGFNQIDCIRIESLCYLKDDVWKKILTHD